MTPIWLRKWASPCARAHYVDFFVQLFSVVRLPKSTVYQQLPQPNEQAIMVPTTAYFTNLPTELIIDITDRLPLDAILALKLTQRRLNSILRLDQQCRQAPRSRCTQRAIQIYLAPSSSPLSHRYCIMCEATVPVENFKSPHSSACLPVATASIPHDVVELPSRVCFAHVARFTRSIKTEAGGRNEWVSHGVKMCMHCGYIQGWTKGKSKCDCECDSCSVEEATAYTRYLPKNMASAEFVFWRDAPESAKEGVGQLWVRETRRDASDEKSIIYLPVRAESA
jgi:hypothetical protein